MFEEVAVVDRITVLEDGQLQVRKALRVLKDRVKIAEKFHREVVVPGQDVSGLDPRIVAIASAIWSAEVIAGYLAGQRANEL